jgi:hypothetical protein
MRSLSRGMSTATSEAAGPDSATLLLHL